MRALSISIGAFVLFASGAFALTECSSSSSGASNANGSDGGGSGSCPTDPPAAGSACSLPSGTQCNDYAEGEPAGCGFGPYICQNGVWQTTGAGPGSSLFCDGTTPEAGSPCVTPSSCPGTENECPFTCPNGQQLTASCYGDKWVVPSCASDADASIDDAGDGGD